MSRTIHRGAIAAAVAAGFVLVAPAAASAHVGVSPDSITAGESAVLTFSFTHGCEQSPTTALRITMPDGLASVAPTVDSTWNIDVERGDDGLVSTVIYTATTPIPGDLRGAVSMAVRLAEDAPETLAFPVEQQCETGVNEWVQLAEDGEDPHDLDAPAPVVAVSSDASSTSGHSSGGHANDTGDVSNDTGGVSEAAATEPATGVPWGTIVGSAGLAVGVAALIVALRARRRLG